MHSEETVAGFRPRSAEAAQTVQKEAAVVAQTQAQGRDVPTSLSSLVIALTGGIATIFVILYIALH